jgi:hypothetical protein
MKSFLNQADKKEIIERLSNLRPDSQRRWGRMTPHQMVCHLSDSFRIALGELSASSVENFFTRSFLVKWFVLYLPLPWPKGVPTRPEVDQQVGGTKPTEFERDRQELEMLIERFIRRPEGFEFSRHPYFGKMTETEWMRWGYLHCDHHLRQFGV